MLVGAFEIDVRRPFQVRTVLQREGVGRARVEPDIEDIHDLRPRLVGLFAEEALTRAFGEPGIGAFLLEGFEDAGVDAVVLQDLALFVDEDADRHAPGALARQNPVRALFDHGAQAVLTGSRHEAGIVDRLQRARTQRRAVGKVLVHVDEPLRRVAEDHRLLRAPGMRIGMLQPSAGKERVRLDQRLDDAGRWHCPSCRCRP